MALKDSSSPDLAAAVALAPPRTGRRPAWAAWRTLPVARGWLSTLALLPFRLAKACWQSVQVVRRVEPDVVVGFGGYISLPAGLMSVLLGKPLFLHEQNSVAGMANKVLARVSRKVFTAFPGVLKNAAWVGNPLRSAFTQQPGPVERFAGRSGPLHLLVVGGSLGAQALNTVVPQALALIPVAAGLLYPFYGTLLSPVFAAGAMAMSSVFVLGNALRLKRFTV